MNRLLYAEKRLYKELTVTVMGKQKKLPISDIDDHLVGVMFVYDNEDKAKEEAGDTGYLVLENGGPAQSNNKKEE